VIRSRDGQVPSHQQRTACRVDDEPDWRSVSRHCHGWPPLPPQHAAGPDSIQLTDRRIWWQ